MPWFAVETHLFVETASAAKAAEIGQEIAITAAHAHRKSPVIMAAFDARVPNADDQEFIAACLAQDQQSKS